MTITLATRAPRGTHVRIKLSDSRFLPLTWDVDAVQIRDCRLSPKLKRRLRTSKKFAGLRSKRS